VLRLTLVAPSSARRVSEARGSALERRRLVRKVSLGDGVRDGRSCTAALHGATHLLISGADRARDPLRSTRSGYGVDPFR